MGNHSIMELIADRSKEINEIVKSIQEINETFRTLSDIIAGQSRKIEGFDGHIEETILRTERACQELEKAADYNRWTTALTIGLMGGAVAGPIGFIAGIKSSLALLGLSVGSGYVSYKMASGL